MDQAKRLKSAAAGLSQQDVASVASVYAEQGREAAGRRIAQMLQVKIATEAAFQTGLNQAPATGSASPVERFVYEQRYRQGRL